MADHRLVGQVGFEDNDAQIFAKLERLAHELDRHRLVACQCAIGRTTGCPIGQTGVFLKLQRPIDNAAATVADFEAVEGTRLLLLDDQGEGEATVALFAALPLGRRCPALDRAGIAEIGADIAVAVDLVAMGDGAKVAAVVAMRAGVDGRTVAIQLDRIETGV